MNFLMEVVIVLFCNNQLLLKLNLSSPQDILFVPGFISLIHHVNQHTLIVAVGNSQLLNFKHLLIPFSRNLLQTLLDGSTFSSHMC
jgi:hypothetical protein